MRAVSDTPSTSGPAGQPSVPIAPRLDRELSRRRHWDGVDQFFLSAVYRPAVTLSPQRVRRTLAVLAKRHDAFQATLQRTQDGHVYRFDRNSPCPSLTEVTIAHAGSVEMQQAVTALTYDLQAHINIKNAPTFLAGLISSRDGQEQRLLWVIHHRFCDLLSFQVLEHEFGVLYQADADDSVALRSLPVQFSRNLASRHEQAQSAAFGACAEYWRRLWSSMPSLPAETAATWQDNLVRTTDSVEGVVPAPIVTRVAHALRERYQLPFHAWILLSIATAVRSTLGPERCGVFTSHHGRLPLASGESTLRTVGDLSTRLPVAIALDADRSRIDLLRDIVDQLLRGERYGTMRDWLPSGILPARIDVGLNYRGWVSSSGKSRSLLQRAPETLPPRDGPEGPRWCLLEWQVRANDDGLTVMLSYSDSLYHRPTMEQLIRVFLDQLSGEDEINISFTDPDSSGCA